MRRTRYLPRWAWEYWKCVTSVPASCPASLEVDAHWRQGLSLSMRPYLFTITFRQYIGNLADYTTAASYRRFRRVNQMEIQNAAVVITGGSRGLGRALG